MEHRAAGAPAFIDRQDVGWWSFSIKGWRLGDLLLMSKRSPYNVSAMELDASARRTCAIWVWTLNLLSLCLLMKSLVGYRVREQEGPASGKCSAYQKHKSIFMSKLSYWLIRKYAALFVKLPLMFPLAWLPWKMISKYLSCIPHMCLCTGFCSRFLFLHVGFWFLSFVF